MLLNITREESPSQQVREEQSARGICLYNSQHSYLKGQATVVESWRVQDHLARKARATRQQTQQQALRQHFAADDMARADVQRFGVTADAIHQSHNVGECVDFNVRT
ncbi:hypothetical protein BaRGS_00028639 [Batillaria attramentaria]|uniref:Uncharacterized protein n=1 Tax=Batillaria attramentaria TaxID=370345 RepID=A0ABD0JYE7_9CAEN